MSFMLVSEDYEVERTLRQSRAQGETRVTACKGLLDKVKAGNAEQKKGLDTIVKVTS